jgi:hypothetical protein
MFRRLLSDGERDREIVDTATLARGEGDKIRTGPRDIEESVGLAARRASTHLAENLMSRWLPSSILLLI